MNIGARSARCIAAWMLTLATGVGANALAEDFPVTIEHKFGDTTIAAEPERIVSVGYTEQDDLFALGKAPIAIRPWALPVPHGIWPWAEAAAGDAEPVVLGSGPLDYEAIAELEPDLIIGIYAGTTREEYDRLSLIAPTVLQPADYVDYATPWEEQTRIIGRAVGKVDEANTLIAGIKNRFEQARAEHPEFEDNTVAAAYYSNGQAGAFASGEPRSRFFTELGFVIPDIYDEQAGDAFYTTFSLERFDLLDVDLLVWYWGELESDDILPLRRTLQAHQDGREVILTPQLRFALSFSSPLSLNYALDELVPVLAETLQ